VQLLKNKLPLVFLLLLVVLLLLQLHRELVIPNVQLVVFLYAFEAAHHPQ
jgi:hypothetical protein